MKVDGEVFKDVAQAVKRFGLNCRQTADYLRREHGIEMTRQGCHYRFSRFRLRPGKKPENGVDLDK